MSMELLNDDYRSLEKSDIFSLGCTLYEVCRGEPLPFSGQEWQDIRGGGLREFEASFELRGLIKEMCSPNSGDRPTASDLLGRRALMSESERQLIIEKNRVRDLSGRMEIMSNERREGEGGVVKTRLQRASTWQG